MLFISVVVSSFFIEEQNMVNRPTVGATAAAFAGLVAAVASITNSLPLAQAFVAPSPAQQPTSARVPRRQSPVTTAVPTSSMSMSYGSGEECPEIPTTPLLSKSFDVAVIALGEAYLSLIGCSFVFAWSLIWAEIWKNMQSSLFNLIDSTLT